MFMGILRSIVWTSAYIRMEAYRQKFCLYLLSFYCLSKCLQAVSEEKPLLLHYQSKHPEYGTFCKSKWCLVRILSYSKTCIAEVLSWPFRMFLLPGSPLITSSSLADFIVASGLVTSLVQAECSVCCYLTLLPATNMSTLSVLKIRPFPLAELHNLWRTFPFKRQTNRCLIHSTT